MEALTDTRTGSIPEGQYLASAYLPQYRTAPTSREVAVDNGTDSVSGGQHRKHAHPSQHRTAPTSMGVPADSETGGVPGGQHMLSYYLTRNDWSDFMIARSKTPVSRCLA